MKYTLIFLISCILLTLMKIFCELYFKDNFNIVWYSGALQMTLLYLLIQIMWNKTTNEIIKIWKKITKKEI